LGIIQNNFTKEEIEIFTIAKDIKDKIMSKYQVFDKDEKILRDITYNDFVILMDRASDFDLYKKIFEFLGIPLTLYKDDKINNSDDIYILKNIIDFVVKINLGEYDTKFKYDFVSLARSYLFELSDDEIFKCFKNNNFKDNIVYLSLKDLALSVTNSNLNDFLEMIIDKTHMYEKFIKVGNIESAMVRISKLYDVANNLGDLGYDIYTFRDYLSELLNSDCEMKYSSVSNQADTVKIMTIHKSKGLEYHICYYSGLYKSFNIKELNDRFLFDNTYGIITPYFKEGINESFLKCLVKYKYFNEEISEKIRLFYVALSRAKEMMILLTPKCSGVECELTDNVVDLSYRQNYRSFSDILNSIKDKLLDYYEEVSLETLELTKDYLYSNKDLEKYFEGNSQEFIVKEIDNLESEEIKKEHFHKDFNELIDKEVKNNIEFGLMMHEALEYIDFKNPDLSCIENEFIKNKVDQFLNNDLLKDIDKAKVYKEYEFIYNNQSSEYHGIIDLMLEYDDRIIIIDYKLSDIALDKYLDQLKGYRTYIERLSSKQVDIYLYSILKGNLKKVL